MIGSPSHKNADHYRCGKCNAHGVKLWRGYNNVEIDLLCVDCACAVHGRDAKLVDEDGLSPGRRPGLRSDQIDGHVPAVPDEHCAGAYWGYTSVPQVGVTWWRRLPLRRVA